MNPTNKIKRTFSPPTEEMQRRGKLLFKWDLLGLAMHHPEIRLADLKVLRAVLNRVNSKSCRAWPSIAKIMKDAALTRSSVKRALARLVELDFLTQEKAYKNFWVYTIGKGSTRELVEPEDKGFTGGESKGSRKHDLESPSVDHKSIDLNPLKESTDIADKKKPAKNQTFQQWRKSLSAKGDVAISPDDGVNRFAGDAELPHAMIRLAWDEFCFRNMASNYRRKNWRFEFEKFVRSNIARLWWRQPGTQEFSLTTAGETLRLAMESRAAEERAKDGQ